MQDNISANEWLIIQMLRTLKPYERVEIVADKEGRLNNYLITRSSKVMLTDTTIIPVK